MSDITPIPSSNRLAPPGRDPVRLDASETGHVNGQAKTETDQLDLSELALLRSRLKDLPEVRAELIERARQGLTDGAYDTPEVLDKAIDGLLGEVDTL